MSIASILIGIVFIIGLIVIISWSLSKYKSKSKEDAEKIENSWPPENYMKLVGSKCPDYWQYVGQSSDGKNICRNMFNIPSGESGSDTCYSDKASNEREFDNIKWPIVDKNFDKTSTCDWVKSCGPTKKTYASWLGITDKC